MRLWERTEGAWLTCLCCGCAINVAIGERHTHRGHTDEHGAVGFERGEVANPGATHAEHDEDKRPQAAERRQERSERAAYQRHVAGCTAVTDLFYFFPQHT